MRKSILITLVIFSFTPFLQAQRCLPKQLGIQVHAGTIDGYHFQNYTERAYYFGLGGVSYTRKGSRWAWGVEYMEKNYPYKHITLPLAQYTAEGGYYYCLLSNKGKDVLVSAGLTGVLGYEAINRGKRSLFDGATITSEDKFLYGLAAALNIDVFIVDRVAVFCNVRERILWGSTVSKFHLQIGVGLRYIFN